MKELTPAKNEVTVEQALLALGYYYALVQRLRELLADHPSPFHNDLISQIDEARKFLRPVTDKVYGPGSV